ncbi:uncharacterized protein LOC105437341 [Strongylocentrotus purpuratus]|uniref:Uncharacterized protein n=1 Tax=Strongylocentrotus purpuratus TaxID=7668 RepID=A0A7M7HCB3_STRPU|nr:uncharacterized protein LOC105437341 [Strongylocentrotus purpuratus]|eukprot:XP_011662131.1 PREDICTED: uncharacterized protein LOC105437341 [Strongylocentrotus purpuratus]
MFHSTTCNINDTFSDSTSLWSLEEGFPSITYYPIIASKQNDSDNNDVDYDNDDGTSTASDCCQLNNEVLIEIHHEDDNDSLLSDTTSSLIRFMDEMDYDSFTDVSSITTDNEDDNDTFTTVTDLTYYTHDIFDDDSSDVILDLSLTKDEYELINGRHQTIESDFIIATTFLDEIISEVAFKLDSNN